ncbi:hypothetical protein RA19_08810 [Leisingera sp. ANG-M1]|uniref:GNAT family N-acetyltransferase n=1 Tax=Leisingera sp. ANG-M1 TaxID=1577895 RepID=UPI00057DFBAD|nr:GNAT family N-acetyltransferase [Leisingera sp. ANG-M1]KIC10842.1 hypothetical protein RA19_08810 [Leisingera sp. ANG-M1]
MQNKRGISQAFAPVAVPQLQIRPATVFDVFDMSRVLISSIRDLCKADHDGDAARIAEWTADKSPERIRTWIEGPGRYWLAELGGAVAGVGGLNSKGAISLLYVAPEVAGQGAGTALLAHLESELLKSGCSEGRLNATGTALEFYQANGWQRDGAPVNFCGTPCLPMHKHLD